MPSAPPAFSPRSLSDELCNLRAGLFPKIIRFAIGKYSAASLPVCLASAAATCARHRTVPARPIGTGRACWIARNGKNGRCRCAKTFLFEKKEPNVDASCRIKGAS